MKFKLPSLVKRHSLQSCFYYKPDVIIENSKDDKEPGLKVLSSVIVSNDTVNERNIAFTFNVKLVNIVRKYISNLHTAFFLLMAAPHSFNHIILFSITYFPTDWKITWDYGEAHHFKSPHDETEGTVKRKIYRF